jgi:hypothetical protein
MGSPKLQVYQLESKTGNTYLVYRYFDDKNNNYEYQTYKLVQSKEVARDFGILDTKEGRKTPLNAREMCDLLIREFEK